MDFMLKINQSGQITQAQGKTARWLGLVPAKVQGRSLYDFATRENTDLISDCLSKLKGERELPRTLLQLRSTNEELNFFAVTGGPLGQRSAGYWMSFKATTAPARGGRPEELDAEDALLDGTAFIDTIEKVLAEGPGEAKSMTFVDIGDVAGLKNAGVAAAAAADYVSKAEASLRAIGGEAVPVGKLGDGRYGVVHDEALVLDTILAGIEALARQVDPDGKVLKVGGSTVKISPNDVPGADLRKVLDAAVQGFVADGLAGVSCVTFNEFYLRTRGDDKAMRRMTLRRAIGADGLSFRFRPVVRIGDRHTDHVVIDPRLEAGDGLSTAELVAEINADKAMRAYFDLAQVNKVAALVTARGRNLPQGGLALGMAIDSLRDGEVMKALMGCAPKMTSSRFLLQLIGLDAKNLGAGEEIDLLRRVGFEIGLVGAQIIALPREVIRKLPIDAILIHLSVLTSLGEMVKIMPLITSLGEFCAGRDIRLIFDGVDGDEVGKLLAGIRGVMGVGALFGEPADSLDKLAA